MRYRDIQKITDDWFDDPHAFYVYKVPKPVSYEIAGADGTLDTLEGPVKYKRGFYLMTGPRGERYPITPDRFHELYTDNKDGTGTPIKIIKSARLADHDGKVKTSWGEELHYVDSMDYIIKHGPGDYGVVKSDIFDRTYKRA